MKIKSNWYTMTTLPQSPSSDNLSLESSKYQTGDNNLLMMIGTKDVDWLLSQSPTVIRLFIECWKSDPFGSRWMPLNTILRDRNLRGAKKVLKDAGLFDFKTESRTLEGKQYYETFVINLHGSRTIYFNEIIKEKKIKAQEKKNKKAKHKKNKSSKDGIDSAAPGNENAAVGTVNAAPGNDNAGVKLETQSEQAFPAPSLTPLKHLTNSSKELVRCAEIIASKECGNNSAGVSPAMPLNSLAGNITPLLGDQELLEALEAARDEKTRPVPEVEDQLKNSKYWTNYAAVAKLQGWHLELVGLTITPEAKQYLKKLRAKGNPRLQ